MSSLPTTSAARRGLGLALLLGCLLAIAHAPSLLAQGAPLLSLEIVEGDGQIGVPGTTLPRALTVRIRSGPTTVAGLTVGFSISADTTGGASLSLTSAPTDNAGRASTLLTLGPNAGTVTVCAVAPNTVPPRVCFTLRAEWPQLRIVGGDGQSVPPFSPFAPLTVGLDPASPQPVSAVSVLWTVLEGEAAFPGGMQSAVTSLPPNGTSSVQLNALAGPSTVRVRAALPGLPAVLPVEFRLAVQPPAAASLVIVSGNRQTAATATAFPSPLVVQALNGGLPAPNVAVNWSVVSGPVSFPGGISSITSQTDGLGRAQAPILANAVPGVATVRAEATGFSPVDFTLFVVEIQDRLVLVSGGGQSGLQGQVSAPIVVRATRGSGNEPLPGRVVEWLVESGSATLDRPRSLTDAQGLAEARFIFGGPGPIVIRARLAGGGESVAVPATSLAPRLVIVSGDQQIGRVGEALPAPLVVRLTGQSGTASVPIQGVTIAWRIVQGGGQLAQAATPTGADGSASNRLTLPASPGTVLIEAAAAGFASVVFRAEARSFLAGDIRLEPVSGNNQRVLLNTLSDPLVVRAVDPRGNPLADVGLRWAVTPASAARAEQEQTRTGPNGQSSNRVRPLESGALRVQVSVFDPPGSTATVTFELNGNIADTPGLPPEERERAVVIDRLCERVRDLTQPTAEQASLREICRRMGEDTADPPRLQQALQRIVAREFLAGSRLGIQAATAQFENLKARMAALRAGAGGLSLQGLTLRDGDSLPLSWLREVLLPAAQEAELAPPWGVFLTGTVGRGRKDPSPREPGYRLDEWSLTGGADYRLGERLVVGAAVGYNASDSRLAAGTGTVDARTRTLAAYLAWNGASSYLDLVLTRAWTRFEYRRELDLSLGQGPNPLVIDQTFLGEADGRQRGITLSAGYELTRGGLSFGPYLRGSWVRQRIDGFVERALFQRAGTALALRVEAQRLESRQLTAGARVQYAVSTSYGVLLPHAQLEYVREYEDDPLAVVIALVHDPSAQRFVLPGDPQDRSFANLGLGVSATLAGGRSGFLYYERALGLNGQRREQLALGLRFEF